MRPRIVVLDRDGVINQDSVDFIKSAQEWQPIDGSLQAIARLSSGGWQIAVATNQSGVARGLISESALQSIHEAMQEQVAALGGVIHCITHCPHAPNSGCGCRKPDTGMLKQIEAAVKCSLQGAPLVGDSLRDMEAALRHGCLPILVRTGNGRTVEPAARDRGVTLVFNDLAEAADWLLATC